MSVLNGMDEQFERRTWDATTTTFIRPISNPSNASTDLTTTTPMAMKAGLRRCENVDGVEIWVVGWSVVEREAERWQISVEHSVHWVLSIAALRSFDRDGMKNDDDVERAVAKSDDLDDDLRALAPSSRSMETPRMDSEREEMRDWWLRATTVNESDDVERHSQPPTTSTNRVFHPPSSSVLFKDARNGNPIRSPSSIPFSGICLSFISTPSTIMKRRSSSLVERTDGKANSDHLDDPCSSPPPARMHAPLLLLPSAQDEREIEIEVEGKDSDGWLARRGEERLTVHHRSLDPDSHRSAQSDGNIDDGNVERPTVSADTDDVHDRHEPSPPSQAPRCHLISPATASLEFFSKINLYIVRMVDDSMISAERNSVDIGAADRWELRYMYILDSRQESRTPFVGIYLSSLAFVDDVTTANGTRTSFATRTERPGGEDGVSRRVQSLVRSFTRPSLISSIHADATDRPRCDSGGWYEVERKAGRPPSNTPRMVGKREEKMGGWQVTAKVEDSLQSTHKRLQVILYCNTQTMSGAYQRIINDNDAVPAISIVLSDKYTREIYNTRRYSTCNSVIDAVIVRLTTWMSNPYHPERRKKYKGRWEVIDEKVTRRYSDICKTYVYAMELHIKKTGTQFISNTKAFI
ncbi:hypothetical protein SCHPADRAFT_893734 [Schizopora paradoxa]|uniref:Uncharacterized protein n=1 Tax=Schizopora paradoxa TaxID=27342 RepID=A0A0H2R9T9_9AGAM|nr:hypothetical protein SCHPADRAFT_893734 [Schizopora paradoxa]